MNMNHSMSPGCPRMQDNFLHMWELKTSQKRGFQSSTPCVGLPGLSSSPLPPPPDPIHHQVVISCSSDDNKVDQWSLASGVQVSTNLQLVQVQVQQEDTTDVQIRQAVPRDRLQVSVLVPWQNYGIHRQQDLRTSSSHCKKARYCLPIYLTMSWSLYLSLCLRTSLQWSL